MTAIAGPAAYQPTLADRIRWIVGPPIYRIRSRFGWLPESNLVKHARRELALLRSGEPDDMQDAIERHIFKMLREFSKEGHSGFSAKYTINLLEKLLRFEPVTPLTGSDDEWMEVGDGCFQNRRCGHVFKGEDGRAYDIDGRVFVEPDGAAFTSRDSRVYVTFPYVPKTEYVRLPKRDASGRFSPSSAGGKS
jgi:hypothetical protein